MATQEFIKLYGGSSKRRKVEYDSDAKTTQLLQLFELAEYITLQMYPEYVLEIVDLDVSNDIAGQLSTVFAYIRKYKNSNRIIISERYKTAIDSTKAINLYCSIVSSKKLMQSLFFSEKNDKLAYNVPDNFRRKKRFS
jgi:hypothetical protein